MTKLYTFPIIVVAPIKTYSSILAIRNKRKRARLVRHYKRMGIESFILPPAAIKFNQPD